MLDNIFAGKFDVAHQFAAFFAIEDQVFHFVRRTNALHDDADDIRRSLR